jgi:hypothetical protein
MYLNKFLVFTLGTRTEAPIILEPAIAMPLKGKDCYFPFALPQSTISYHPAPITENPSAEATPKAVHSAGEKNVTIVSMSGHVPLTFLLHQNQIRKTARKIKNKSILMNFEEKER